MGKFSLGLLKERDFRRFWLGHTFSAFGAQITLIAIPLIAAISLDVTPFQMGILQAIEFLPYMILSLFVGVWVDRKPKRLILITADLLRALLLAVVPLGMYFNFLSIPLLYVISALVGANTVFFDIGHTSFLPSLVKREDLIEGNSKLEFSSASSTVIGQSIGGLLVQIFTAPFAILFNVGTYLFSAMFLSFIRKEEVLEDTPQEKVHFWKDAREGTSFVFGNTVIRTLLIATLIFNLFTYLIEPIFILYISRTLELSPVYIGLIFSMSGVGALLGAMLARPFAEKLGVRRALVASLFLAGLASFLIPFATLLPVTPAVILIMVMYMIDAAMVIVYNINQRSLRTSITPDNLLGRMNATIRLFVMGVVPIGALLGGWLGGWIGTTYTLVIGACGLMFSSLFFMISSRQKRGQTQGTSWNIRQ